MAQRTVHSDPASRRPGNRSAWIETAPYVERSPAPGGRRRPGNRSAWIETVRSWPDRLRKDVAGRETGRRGLKRAARGGQGRQGAVAGRETGRRGLKPKSCAAAATTRSRRPGNRSAWIETACASNTLHTANSVAGRETGRRGLKHGVGHGAAPSAAVAGRETGRRGLKHRLSKSWIVSPTSPAGKPVGVD